MATEVYRGGPYAFRESVICARCDPIRSNTGTNVVLTCKSAYYPVSMTSAGVNGVKTFVDSSPMAVIFTGLGTHTLTFTDELGNKDVIDIVVA